MTAASLSRCAPPGYIAGPHAPPARCARTCCFSTEAGAAEAAGFRACKRCHPRAEIVPAAALAQQAATWIDANGNARLASLAQALHVSPFHLQRVFTRVMGVSPAGYARARRAGQLKSALRQTPTATEAIFEAGFGSSAAAYAPPAGGLGMTPAVYQRGGRGMQIGFALLDSPLGRMLVAGTARGLCAVYFGDSDSALEAELLREYPEAAIEKHISSALSEWVGDLLAYLERRGSHGALAALPLDVQGTAFQARVWQALRMIPEGEVRSYGDVARAIGAPTAMRAVANACGANRVAVVIACHRVVREGVREGKSAGIGGYRWGVARKAQLLTAERVDIAQGAR